MSKTLKERPHKKKIDVTKALAQFHKLREHGLGDRFKGMSEDEIIGALKKTRETIWQEKLATRT